MTGSPGKFVLVAAWYSAIALTALVAVGVELDRQSRFDPRIAAIVPDPFQGDALENLTKRAFERNDSVHAEALARKLVERRPIPAEALSLYAASLLANGKERAAIAALQSAAGRGWRDRFVQRVTILSALQQGHPEIAANRVIGLWRMGERADWLKDLTRATLEVPDGVSAFEAGLIEHDRYIGTDFLTWAAGSLPIEIVEKLAGRMAANRTEFDCPKFSSQTDVLVTNSRGLAAAAIWKSLCASNRHSSMNDLAFETMNILPGPFGWRYPENAGVDVDLRRERKEVVLHYSSADPLLRTIARRYIELAPGQHVLNADSATISSGAKWRIACVARGRVTEVRLDAIVDGQWAFVIPPSCPVQEFSILTRSGAGDINTMQLSHSQQR